MFLLELLNGNADRGLGEAQSFGCMCKAPEVRCFEKDPHLFEGHGTSSSSAGCDAAERTRTFGVGSLASFQPILSPSLLENQSTVPLPMNSAHPRGCDER